MKNRGHHPIINYRSFIEDFNILTQQTPDNRSHYQEPEIDSIENDYDRSILKNGLGQPYPLGCSIEEFKRYGLGIYFLFKFLKLVVAIFAILSIILIANIVFFSVGKQLENNSYKANTFNARMAITTLGNLDQKFVQATAIIYFVSLIIFTGGIIFWKERQSFEVIECSKEKLLPSYYTVILEEIPIGFSENQLKNYLEANFGKVKEIFSAKQFNNDLIHFKEIDEIIQQYKIQRSLLRRNRQQKNTLKLIGLFKEFYYFYIRMKSHKRARYQPAFAFITFNEVSSRERLLEVYNEHKPCCKNQQNDRLKHPVQNLKFSPCKMEPDAISWENVTLTTKNMVLRIFFQITLLVIVLIFSVAMIFLLALAQSNLVNSKYSAYSYDQILTLSDKIATKYYCLNLSLSDFSANQICSPYNSAFVKIIILELTIPLVISLLKFLFTELMKYVVNVRRHPTQIKKIESQIIISFIFYFIISGLLQLLINIEVLVSEEEVISIKQFFQTVLGAIYHLFPVDEDIQTPTDFTNNWFYSNSNKVILISIISFNFTSLFNIIYSVIRRKLCIYFAKKQPTNTQAAKYLKAQNLQIEFIYAFALNIIFFTLLFGAIIPLVWIFGCLSLFILFWAHKFIFIRYCQSPLIFCHSINHLVTRIILFGIVFSCLMFPLLYGGINGSSLGGRYITYLYFPIFGGLILAYMFFRKVLLKIILDIICCLKGNEKGRDRLPSFISKINSKSDELPSYSMHQNKVYSSVLKVLYTLNEKERTRATFMLNENLSDFFSHYQSKEKHCDSFRDLLDQILADRQRFNKTRNSKSFSNPFGQNQKNVKEMFRIYAEHRSKMKSSQNVQPSNNVKQNPSYISQILGYENGDKIIQDNEKEKANENENNGENVQSERKFNKIERAYKL